jgi:ABC-2 type transport system ATP-binding protein
VAWSWQVPRRWQRPGPAAAPADRAAIAAAGLSKCYGRGLALAGLDLRVAAGETVALLGPDGAGKSTAIGLLLGLLGPDRGRVRVYDRPPSQAVAGGLAGAMLQDAGLMPGVRVGELLAMVGGLYRRPLPAAELAALADLGSVLGRRADRLSGGQAQRVRFAAAVAGDPQLLLLDEPTAAMDVQGRRDFWAQIHRSAARGRTVLFATHYLQEADDAADRVVVIPGGRKVADGPPGAIKARFGDPRVRFILRPGRAPARPSPSSSRCSTAATARTGPCPKAVLEEWVERSPLVGLQLTTRMAAAVQARCPSLYASLGAKDGVSARSYAAS